MIRLLTWRWMISAFLTWSRSGSGSLSVLAQGPEGVVDRGLGLLLDREDPVDLLADGPLLVLELALDVLLGDDPEPHLAALADVGALEVVEVAALGVERDHGAGLEVLERREVPAVADLLAA